MNSVLTSFFHKATGLGALALLLTGCDTAIDVPEPEHTPRVALALTIDNLAPSDSVVRQLYITRQPFVSVSQRLYDLTPLQGRNNATIEISDGSGNVVERYRPVAPPSQNPYGYQNGMYRPVLRYRFRPGQQYAVRVSVPGVEPATSSLTLPDEVAVQVNVAPLSSNSNGLTRARVTVSFDDPAGSRDYYLATAQIVDQQGRGMGYVSVEDDENGLDITSLRLSGSSPYDMYPFSDATVNGQRVSFSNNVEYYDNGTYNPSNARYLLVTLTHLTPDLFQFLNSYIQYSDNDGNPFAEPTPLYSNVQPGFGIFGGATDSRAQVRL
ncbi:DUF4249 domain-containing protein [Hymenobacter sp. CRA2]|uniref:DUF4249 domain-containing protein n=1 Tax=Hymenobacter sp. CRA2 TaxID=1955620 RepID=UPI00098EB8C2|nr:DUF4249 domain-containing protein [Hymenobacter sp. CRA2]OON67453.1 hypothetical protein B0919_18505 [Hymenobacter sp. CRA2]